MSTDTITATTPTYADLNNMFAAIDANVEQHASLTDYSFHWEESDIDWEQLDMWRQIIEVQLREHYVVQTLAHHIMEALMERMQGRSFEEIEAMFADLDVLNVRY